MCRNLLCLVGRPYLAHADATSVDSVSAAAKLVDVESEAAKTCGSCDMAMRVTEAGVVGRSERAGITS